jgi:hypothetical protein
MKPQVFLSLLFEIYCFHITEIMILDFLIFIGPKTFINNILGYGKSSSKEFILGSEKITVQFKRDYYFSKI